MMELHYCFKDFQNTKNCCRAEWEESLEALILPTFIIHLIHLEMLQLHSWKLCFMTDPP